MNLFFGAKVNDDPVPFPNIAPLKVPNQDDNLYYTIYRESQWMDQEF